MNVGVTSPAFRGKLCSVLSWYLVPIILVLSFNQENRLVVFLFIELLTVSLVNTGS